MVTLVIATNKEGVMGISGNKLPWTHNKTDLNRFKSLTINKTIVMGRKTFDSLPGILPGRKHVVLTRQKITIPGVTTINNISELEDENYIIIGGREIINLLYDFIDKIELSIIDYKVPSQSSNIIFKLDDSWIIDKQYVENNVKFLTLIKGERK